MKFQKSMQISYIKISSRNIFLFACFTAGLLILSPSLNFQPLLSPGDHGRDFYCFEQTLKGQVPYRDYWWVYGPLMPYYYALWYGLLGINMQSILLGKLFLNLLCGLLFFMAASVWMAPAMAFITALWFWVFHPDFFFTYNHIGGVFCLIASIYFLFLYIKKPLKAYVYGGLCSIFILSLIKLNIGFSTLLAFVSSVWIRDFLDHDTTSEKNRFYILSLVSFPLVVLSIYYFFLKGLPLYYIRQCFPYLKADHQYYAAVSQTLPLYLNFIFSRMATSWTNLFFGSIFVFSLVQTIYKITRKNSDPKLRKNIFALSASFILFSTLNLHEFLNSGVLYRTFWIDSFKILFIFIIIEIATEKFARALKYLLYATLGLCIITQAASQRQMIEAKKDSAHYLTYKKSGIFVGNAPNWVDTVQKTKQYLNSVLKSGEQFLAIPYDPLYYFLTARQSPTPHLIFFDHINIQPEQEKEIMKALEAKKINCILLSSRIKAREQGLGTFGQTYCPLLGKYIRDNFKTAATFGDWANEPGWAWNHGTKILKRIKPL